MKTPREGGASTGIRSVHPLLFPGSAIMMVLLTAFATLVAASGEVGLLGHPDPLLRLLSLRQSMLLAAALEIVVVMLVWRAPTAHLKATLLLWIGSVFLFYRIGLWWVGFEGSCRCLGNVGDVFGISTETADWIAKGILVYLLVGSGAILLWQLSHRGDPPGADDAVQIGTETKLSPEAAAGKSGI
jgi:hypothetical protein